MTVNEWLAWASGFGSGLALYAITRAVITILTAKPTPRYPRRSNDFH